MVIAAIGNCSALRVDLERGVVHPASFLTNVAGGNLPVTFPSEPSVDLDHHVWGPT